LSLTDAARALVHCLTTPGLQGPVNLVAPNPVPQAELATTLGQVLRRPAILPMPALMVKIMFGAMGKTLLLQSCAVSSAKLQASGFVFQHPTLKAALHAELA
jgi:NAD dependent epimerase/dehydratase family enzyme